MIFRDDDISYVTDLIRFRMVDSIFQQYQVPHTIAVITFDMYKRPDLIEYILKNPHIDVQLHCVDHKDFTLLPESELRYQFEIGIKDIQFLFEKTPTTWYPPWNRTNEQVNTIARSYGLTPSWEKISLSPYVQAQGHMPGAEVINFHYWADQECQFLHPALEYYKNNLNK